MIQPGRKKNNSFEVSSGNVSIVNKITKKSHLIDKQQRLTLNNNQVTDFSKLTKTLKWSLPKNFRVYSHFFPAQIQVSWDGQAENILLIDKENKKIESSVAGSQKFYTMLNPGTYIFQL